MDVVRLCRRLNGIPLAIELAAVRLRALPLVELANLLDSGFSVLTVTRRGGVARHQTLRTAIEWSHALCTPTEQALWRRLSVFAGSFDVAAAEEVCADPALPRDEVVHALIGLVDKSVVMRDGDVGGGGGFGGDGLGGGGFGDGGFGGGASGGANRYRLLDTLREFGGRAAGGGRRAGAVPRPADRPVPGHGDRLRRTVPCWRPGGPVPAAAGGAAEHRDRARARARQPGRRRRPGGGPSRSSGGGGGCWLAVRLHAYWRIAGLLGEGRHWLDKALRVFPGWSAERARALAARGRLATFQGDPDSAIADISESIRLAGELGDDRAAACGYVYLNLALTFAGQYEQALAAGQLAANGWPPATTGWAWPTCSPNWRSCISSRGTSTRLWSAASAAWRCWRTSIGRARSAGRPDCSA